MRKTICGMIIALLIVSVFSLALSIQLVKAEPETVYIKADGSVFPPSAPISNVGNVSYTFTGDINDSLVVQRNNIVVDGAGHVLEGTGTGRGIDLTGRSNVTIKSVTIRNFSYGIYLSSGSSGNTLSANNVANNDYAGIYIIGSSNNSVSANNMTNNQNGIWLLSSNYNNVSANSITNSIADGVYLYGCGNNRIYANNVTSSRDGIWLVGSSNNNIISANNASDNSDYGITVGMDSSNNVVSANIITNNGYDGVYVYSSNNIVSANNITNNRNGILIDRCFNNTVSANNITNNDYGGIYFYGPSNNSISANNIANNDVGVYLDSSANNLFYHNNFVGNTEQVTVTPLGNVNVWNDNYPSGGNYWSDYAGVDLYKGPNQNVAGSDGIGDTPYTIDANNTDKYPLMKPWTAITNIASLAIRRTNNLTSYRTYNATTNSWTGWNTLPKATCGSPAAAICNNELHMVIRDLNGDKLYHGYVNLATSVFSGWKLISGLTPSAPTLTSNGTVLCLVVRGADNRTRYRVYSFSPSRSWGTWKTLARTTCDGAAAAMLGNNLHIITRSLDGKTLWHIIVKPNAGIVRKWIKISGSTPSKPALTANQTTNKLYLVIRRSDNKIQWRTYDSPADKWAGWKTLSTGTTCDGPAATALDNKLHIVIRSITGTTLRHGHITLATSAFSGWTTLTGSTPSAPTLTS